MDIYSLAKQMLGVEELDPSLVNRLNYASALVSNAGGELISRQAIAAIITAWEYAN